ncbi:hypothetical protein WEI85_06360 [Actinomycetes bacterium KLBMP 9797]
MRETFDEFIGASPGTRVDLDAIVRRSRTIRRRRRVVAACATGLAVVGVTALSFAIAPGPQAAPAPASTPTPTSTGTPSGRAAEQQRLFAALKAAIAREAPQVTGIDNLRLYVYRCGDEFPLLTQHVPAGSVAVSPPCPTPTTSPAREIDREFLWRGRLTSPTGTYEVRVHIAPTVYVDPDAPPVNEMEAAERAAAAAHGEAPRRGPGGESILVDGGALLNLTKPDGTGIMIRTWDTNRAGAYRTRSPFTADQLTAIGLDLALHL